MPRFDSGYPTARAVVAYSENTSPILDRDTPCLGTPVHVAATIRVEMLAPGVSPQRHYVNRACCRVRPSLSRDVALLPQPVSKSASCRPELTGSCLPGGRLRLPSLWIRRGTHQKHAQRNRNHLHATYVARAQLHYSLQDSRPHTRARATVRRHTFLVVVHSWCGVVKPMNAAKTRCLVRLRRTDIRSMQDTSRLMPATGSFASLFRPHTRSPVPSESWPNLQHGTMRNPRI